MSEDSYKMPFLIKESDVILQIGEKLNISLAEARLRYDAAKQQRGVNTSPFKVATPFP